MTNPHQDTIATHHEPHPEPHHAATDEQALDAGFAMAKVSPWTTREKRTKQRREHNWYAWRRMVLRAFGARIAPGCTIRPTVHIEIPWLLEMDDGATLGDHAIIYNLGLIRIGKRTTLSQYAHLCAGSHDMTKADLPLLRPPITVGDDCWIAADAFVGPGITLANGTVLGARSSLFTDTEPWSVYIGNPAKKRRSREKPAPANSNPASSVS